MLETAAQGAAHGADNRPAVLEPVLAFLELHEDSSAQRALSLLAGGQQVTLISATARAHLRPARQTGATNPPAPTTTG
jgi:hypothetical protein